MMSKFIKALDKISGGNVRPLGFSGEAKVRQAPMMLVAQLSKADAELAKSAISAKADALLFTVEKAGDVDALSSISHLASEVPWGVRALTKDAKQINRLPELGCDYLVFDWELPARCIRDERLGRILEVDISLNNACARAIGQLSLVDAIFIAGESQSKALTIRQLSSYLRLSESAARTALAPVPASIDDIGILPEAGIRGVITEITAEHLTEMLARVREAIEKLPISKHKLTPTLPMLTPLKDEQEI